MGQQVEAAAIDGFLSDDVPAVRGEGLDRVRNSSGAGGHGQGRAAAFEGGDSLFEDALGGVGQSPIDIAGVRKAEPVCRMLAVMEHIRSGLVDGDGAGIGGGVRLLLPDVELQSFEFVVAHGVSPSLLWNLVFCH